MATKKQIRNYAEANGISREAARQHFINEAKNRKPKAIMVLPLDDADLYKGKTVKQYIDDNNISDCIVTGTVFDINIYKYVQIGVIISNSLDEDAAMQMSKSIWDFNKENNPTDAEQFIVWMPFNNFLDLTISGTGELRLGHPSGYGGACLVKLFELLGMNDEVKDSLKNSYTNNKDFATALDNLNPEYAKML